jgi:hypothetical protein
VPDDRSSTQTQQQSAAIPAWITPALIARTRHICEPRYGHPLTNEDVVEILMTVGALGDVLRGDDPLDNHEDDRPPEMLQEIA